MGTLRSYIVRLIRIPNYIYHIYDGEYYPLFFTRVAFPLHFGYDHQKRLIKAVIQGCRRKFSFFFATFVNFFQQVVFTMPNIKLVNDIRIFLFQEFFYLYTLVTRKNMNMYSNMNVSELV